MTYRRGDYALPPCDSLDAALISLGMMIEGLLPDDELIEPTRYPPIAMQIGRSSPRAPRFAVIEHP